ncbi:bifunctional riboflavin kinase/FAD synthetase [Geomonas sp. RF6]|uniref:bifunctional riboflavin kinase/FAD synthetase n=1 Tax=Geomonas sp. RF6 TaxID=2897342 RepID=UPI001E56FACA|nr:bifunctional riboflavin kinase/FAD synthetase [Geomonas sp. RF6]UFS69702.1 bifunctional riboflavin kinase/FAD synthetase [Geomonas sp. RF6]
MIIYRQISDLPAGLPHPVVTIGNFDGVHLGHRQVLSRVREEAQRRGGVSVVITFVPHPLQVLSPGVPLKLITTPAEKAALIAASEIDYLLEIPFDAAFAATPARVFVEEVLVGRIGVELLVIGYDYAFGRGREGEPELLRLLGERHNFSVELLNPVSNGTIVYSSTAVRRMVEHGDVKGVVAILGRHYCMAGEVVHGFHRGRTLGYPTANLKTEKDLVPCAGVYAVKVRLGDELFDGACNVGTNPTFANAKLSMEVFLFDFDRDIYGETICVYFIDRVRGEKRFPGVDALRQAIAQDVEHCRELLESATLIDCHTAETC